MPVIGQNYTAHVYVTVLNEGDFPETFNVTVYANFTEYANSTEIGKQEVTLNLGQNATIPFIWNTTGFAKGNYTISAYAWPVSGETETADNRLNDIYIFVTLPGDINGDKKVDILDAIKLANAFGSKLGDPSWNPNADINDDHRVNILDAIILSNHFGERDP
jgi:hypothetical protein